MDLGDSERDRVFMPVSKKAIYWPPDVKSQLFGFPTPMLGKMEGKRRREQQRMRWLDSFTDSMEVNLSKLWETIENNSNNT